MSCILAIYVETNKMVLHLQWFLDTKMAMVEILPRAKHPCDYFTVKSIADGDPAVQGTKVSDYFDIFRLQNQKGKLQYIISMA